MYRNASNAVQELTRKAARKAVVRWIDTPNQNIVKTPALFGGMPMPAENLAFRRHETGGQRNSLTHY